MPFYSTMFTVFFTLRELAEKSLQRRRRDLLQSRGACFSATMMHADRYSIPATTKGKRFHPLAIKAR
jgi:hypothetical protein